MKLFLKVAGITLLILAVLVALHRPLLNAAGRWLIVQDPLERADIIVVLSGGAGDERVRQGAVLYHDGYAPMVLLSGGEEMAGISIPEVQRRQALAYGVPASALLYETASTSTYEQARDLLPQLQALGIHRAIVVTSSFHSRRVRYLFGKVFAHTSIAVHVYPVQQDSFHPEEWWTREADTEHVVLEYIKLALGVFR